VGGLHGGSVHARTSASAASRKEAAEVREREEVPMTKATRRQPNSFSVCANTLDCRLTEPTVLSSGTEDRSMSKHQIMRIEN
jgi:hypothetical protein